MTGGNDPCTPGAGLQKRFPEMSATCMRGHPLQGVGVHGLDRGCPESLSEEAVLSRPRPEVGVLWGGKGAQPPSIPIPACGGAPGPQSAWGLPGGAKCRPRAARPAPSSETKAGGLGERVGLPVALVSRGGWTRALGARVREEPPYTGLPPQCSPGTWNGKAARKKGGACCAPEASADPVKSRVLTAELGLPQGLLLLQKRPQMRLRAGGGGRATQQAP